MFARSRFLSDYGMILPLLVLGAAFSVVTLDDQFPTGESAARQVARDVLAKFPDSPKVLIAASRQPDDRAFAEAIRRELSSRGIAPLAVVEGEAKDARAAVAALAAKGELLDAIACTKAAADWIVFADLPTDFPKLGAPLVASPRSYRWPTFLKADNLRNIANQIAVIAIIAIGMTMVIITGGIDLSVGSLVALGSVLAALLIRDCFGGRNAGPAGLIAASVASILICGLIGCISGATITAFDVPPFIVSLATMLVASGAAGILSNSESIYQIPESYMWLGRGADLPGIPNAVALTVILYAAAHVLMSRMKLGRYIYAVGGNREAARLSGVPVKRVLIFAYAASALLAGLGGVILASQLKSGSPLYGNMYEFYVIAAVVVGGASISGGEGRMFGTLIGALTIAVIQNGMNLVGIGFHPQRVILGAVILGAVLFDRVRQRRAV